MLMQEILYSVVLVFTFAIVYLSASPLDPVRHMKGKIYSEINKLILFGEFYCKIRGCNNKGFVYSGTCIFMYYVSSSTGTVLGTVRTSSTYVILNKQLR